MIYFMIRRSMSFTELMDCLPEGFKQMVPAILILCMAWTISGVTRDGLGAPEFVADFVEQLGPRPAQLPARRGLHHRLRPGLRHRHLLGHLRHPAAHRAGSVHARRLRHSDC